MKSKMANIVFCVVMVTSILGTIPQNVGNPSSNFRGTEELVDSISQNIGGLSSSGTGGFADSFPQNVGEPNPSSSGSGGLADSPWPMFRQNLNHTGLSPYDTSANNGKLKWSFTTGHNVLSSPAVGSDGTIYVGSDDDKLYAINPDSTEKWNFTTGANVRSNPAISYDGTIYVGSHDNKLYAINPDGTEKWNFTTGYIVRTSPAIGSDGTIYVGSLDGKLYAINPDGTEKWSFMTGSFVNSSPAIGSDGTIYVGSVDHNLYAINPDGAEKWSFMTGQGVGSSPAIDSDGTIYVGSDDNKLYAINPDGTEKWNFPTGDDVYSSPAIGSDGTIYVGSEDYKLYAINPDGSEKWSFATGDEIHHSSPAIGSDGTIYIGSWDEKLHAINPDGTEKWSFATGSFGRSSPAIGSDGTIYIGSSGTPYKLYAIGKGSSPPIADAGLDQTVNEGDAVDFDGSVSYDPDGTIVTYEWDFDEDDGLWWETGAAPDAVGVTAEHTYGDDGGYNVTLRVTDDQGLSGTDICNITVLNVVPTVTIESATMNVEIGLRVAGRKYNDVGMTLYEDGNQIGYVSIEHMPGSPNDQIAWIPVTLDMTKTYSATVTYTPEDPPKVGANPVWIYIKFEDGSIKKIRHTFNVQQSKKRDSDHWNHIDPWGVEFAPHLGGYKITFEASATDSGSDDLIFYWDFGDGNSLGPNIHYNNGLSPDLPKSPDINPMTATDTVIHKYSSSGIYTITLTVTDDDGGTTTITLVLTLVVG